MIYWTKQKTEFNEELDMYVEVEGLEIIQEFDGDEVPDGSGFEIDLNGISYKKYLKSPDKYEVVEGKLYLK